jgi:hypothetical protein
MARLVVCSMQPIGIFVEPAQKSRHVVVAMRGGDAERDRDGRRHEIGDKRLVRGKALARASTAMWSRATSSCGARTSIGQECSP